jgi:hypothetical protein
LAHSDGLQTLVLVSRVVLAFLSRCIQQPVVGIGAKKYEAIVAIE